jgi:hypothetical protein
VLLYPRQQLISNIFTLISLEDYRLNQLKVVPINIAILGGFRLLLLPPHLLLLRQMIIEDLFTPVEDGLLALRIARQPL